MTPTRTLTLAATLALAILVAACGDDTTSSGSTPPIVDGTTPTTVAPPPDTAAPTTDAPPPSAPGDEESDEYQPATSFVTVDGDRTAPIIEPLADGVYYSADYSTEGGAVVFTVSQYFLCDSETNVSEYPTIVCASGFGTLDEPTIDIELAADATVTIATGDLDAPSFARVSAAEFARLVDGDSPSPRAPAGFEFASRPMFVEVSAGTAVDASQFHLS